MTPADLTLCRSCGARIFFATTRSSSKAMPVDAEPVKHGNLTIAPTRTGGFRATVLSGSLLLDARALDEDLYVSHFATCRDAGSWRARKGARR